MSWLSGPLARDEGGRVRRHLLRTAALRRAALRYAQHGWDVLPGACHVGRRFDCGRAGCRTVGCHPAVDDWESVATTDPGRVAAWWSRMPYSVLLATGRAFDVVEVSAELGRLAMLGRPAVSLRAPVAVAADGRWMFLVRPGHGLRPELASRPGIVLHGYGSWVPAPPSRQQSGRVRWRIAPEEPDWRLGDPYVVQLLLSRAVRAQLAPRTLIPAAATHIAQRVA